MAVLPLSGCVHFIARPASYLRGERHHATAADALNFRVAVRLQGGRGSNDAKASLLSAADAKEQRFGGRGVHVRRTRHSPGNSRNTSLGSALSFSFVVYVPRNSTKIQ